MSRRSACVRAFGRSSPVIPPPFSVSSCIGIKSRFSIILRWTILGREHSTAPCYNENFHHMLAESIQELASRPLARIVAARSAEALEAVRVDAVGRKGALAEISKGMGKLSPEERKRIGQVLNAAKQQLEAALDARKQEFDEAALRARLDAEW